jgi:branched-chain amino acid transport system substrate-binding protein
VTAFFAQPPVPSPASRPGPPTSGLPPPPMTPIGTFPAGVGASSVFVGLCCPLTGSYGADGEDLRRGYLLALNDLNNGTGVMAQIPSLRGKKGLLGKKIE